jgi:hypothetical protein
MVTTSGAGHDDADGRAAGLRVRRRSLAMAPAALAVLDVAGLSGCNATSAGGTRTYRAHAVSFGYPAGWQEGSLGPGFGCCKGQRLWADGFGLDTDSVDVGANRSSPSITAANATLFIPFLDRFVRGFFRHAGGSLHAGPERITMGGMPAFRYHGSARVNGTAQEVTLIVAFYGTTQYRRTCGHTRATAAEVARACAQVMRSITASPAR